MNKYIQSEASQHVMKLVQMGAEVNIVSGKMVYVGFEVAKDLKVSYLYHLNKKNKFFLERIRPYPVPVREFDSPDAICDIIKIDVEQFKIAHHSHNIKSFVDINIDFHDTTLKFEDLFLYYNVEEDTFTKIKDHLNEIHNLIRDAKRSASRVFFEKEPENLE